MTRIIAGACGGRLIEIPARGTRPTAARVRESLFSSLEAERPWDQLRALDLFAGSGALGLEAVSRGCQAAVLVESDPAAARICRLNASRLGMGQAVTVRATSVRSWLRSVDPSFGFDLVFLDPPYELDDDAVDGLLAALVDSGVLRPEARLVVERAKRSRPPQLPTVNSPVTARRFGDTVIYRAVWYGP